MKKLLMFWSVLCILTALLGGCDSSLKIKKIEMAQMPDKLVYTTSDSALDLTGGIVRRITAGGKYSDISLSRYPVVKTKNEYGIYSQVDFQTPGNYRVIITQYDGVQCSFWIQVR